MIQFNSLLMVFLAAFLFRSFAQVFLNEMNISYLHRHQPKIPEFFKEVIDPEKFEKISHYTVVSDRFSIVSTLVNQGAFLVLLFWGLLPWIETRFNEWGPIGGGLIFFAIFSVFFILLRIPFSLYDTFVIEDRYGFNTMTFKMWILDLIKGLAIVTLLGGLLLWFLLSLMVHEGRLWWLWAWLLVGCFELLLLWLFPVVIAPLFNKFEPLENKHLEDHLRILMEKGGLSLKGVLKMDASKRSKHTNAFFTGIGKNKRIVLFDTLLQSHPEEEILAVVAHEVGHWKRKHIFKQIVLTEILSLVLFYLVSKWLHWPLLYQTFGFQKPTAYIGLFLIGMFLSPLSYIVQPFGSAISRRFELEADDFSAELMKTAEPLWKALRRLAADNLENLIPHPFYVWFYYSHPPLAERIRRLKNQKDDRRPL